MKYYTVNRLIKEHYRNGVTGRLISRATLDNIIQLMTFEALDMM